MMARHWLPPQLRSGLAHRLIGATIGSSGVWATGTLVTFGIGILLARPLGPEGYGVYGTALAIVSLLSVVATLGIPLVATRELAAAKAQGDAAALAGHRRWFPRLVLATSLATAAVLLLGLLLLGPVVAPRVREVLVWAALLLPGMAACTLASAMLRGLGDVVMGQTLEVLVRPLLFAAGLAALYLLAVHLTPERAMITQCLSTATAAALGFWWLGARWSEDVRTAVPQRALRRWKASAWPLAVMDSFRAVEGNYGVLLVSALSTTTEAGLLRVALASLALCVAPISLQNLIVAPYLSEAAAQARIQQVQRIAAGSALFMAAAVGAVTLFFVLAGPWLLPTVFGAGFAPAYRPLVILCLGQFVTAAAGPGVTLLAMLHAEKAAARTFAVPTLLGAASVVVVAPLAGATGAAAVMLASSILRAAMVRQAVWKHAGIRISVLSFHRKRG